MKKSLLLFALFLIFAVPSFASSKINVLKVYDGDSILAQINDNIFRIRLIGIDCFEGTINSRAKWQSKKYKMPLDKITEGGNIAGDILYEKLNNKDVFFDFKGIDKYGRALGVLYVDKRNINNEMLETNYCKILNR